MAESSEKVVGIIGSGLVGKSFAMIFASAGYQIRVYDVSHSMALKAVDDISSDMDRLEKVGGLRGEASAQEQKKLVTACESLEDTVKDAVYVQESVPEKLELKRSVWMKIDAAVVRKDAILASSTSCIVPSKISDAMKHREQFIVAHPCNPPYLAPMVELVPAPWTSESIREATRKIMKEVGQAPVSMTREIPGFVLNRLQYAILGEAWRLVAGNVVSADDLDTVMRDGIGLRFAFIGPMETMQLNAEGTQNYMDRYGTTMTEETEEHRREVTTMTFHCYSSESTKSVFQVAYVSDEMESLYPLDSIPARRARRDVCLAALAKLKKDLPK